MAPTNDMLMGIDQLLSETLNPIHSLPVTGKSFSDPNDMPKQYHLPTSLLTYDILQPSFLQSSSTVSSYAQPNMVSSSYKTEGLMQSSYAMPPAFSSNDTGKLETISLDTSRSKTSQPDFTQPIANYNQPAAMINYCCK